MPQLLHTIGHVFDAQARRKFTPNETRAAVAELRARFAAAGLRTGDRVLLSHGNSWGFLTHLFALWELGVCAVPLDPAATAPERKNLADFTGARALAGETLEILRGPDPGGGLADSLDLDAVVLFTSGSTHQPKGVALTFRALLAKLMLFRSHMPAADMARTLNLLPTHFGYGLISNSLYPLLCGGTLHYYQPQDLQVLSDLGRVIDDHRISFFCSVPSMWRIALRTAAPPRAGTLRRVHCAASPLAADLARDARDWCGNPEFKNVYGMTEMSCVIAGPEDGEDCRDNYVGRGWGTNIRIVEGEVWLQNASMMRGYLHRPDLAPVIADGWFRTGDLGELDANGGLTLLGRSRYVINRAGMKVYPEELDLLLGRHPAVKDACTFAVPDEIAGEVVGAAVVFHPSAADNAALEAWCRSQISGPKVPTRWFAVPEIPRNSRGKVNRDQVKSLCLGHPR